MIHQSPDATVHHEPIQVDLSEAFRKQVDYQIRILQAAINSLKQSAELELPRSAQKELIITN